MSQRRGTRTLYIGYTQAHYETRRNLTDGDIEYLTYAAASIEPPITPTRLIEEIISCWCAERRCGHIGTSETTPTLPEGDKDED